MSDRLVDQRGLPTGYVFWIAMTLLLGLLLSTVGTLFLIGGTGFIGSSPAYVILEHALPGGLRTHGAFWLATGAVIIVSAVAEHYAKLTARVLNVSLVVALLDLTWSALAFGFAGQAGGRTSWIGVVIWSFLAIWPLLTWVLRPLFAAPEVCAMRAELVSNGLSREAADRIVTCRIERQFRPVPDDRPTPPR